MQQPEISIHPLIGRLRYSSYGSYGYGKYGYGYGKYGYGKEKERRNSDRTAREQGEKA